MKFPIIFVFKIILIKFKPQSRIKISNLEVPNCKDNCAQSDVLAIISELRKFSFWTFKFLERLVKGYILLQTKFEIF